MHNTFSHALAVAAFLIASLGLSRAQTGPDGEAGQLPPPPASAAIPLQTGGEGLGFQFVSAESAVSARVVKGAPFSLEAKIESVQTLSDGNRIVHRQAAHLYRDSAGRTRREDTLAAIGPWAASGTPLTIVTLQDPVSGVNYSLDPKNKTATRLPSGPPGKGAVFIGLRDAGGGNQTTVSSPGVPPGLGLGPVEGAGPPNESFPGVVANSQAVFGSQATTEETSESIGKENIAGVSADGTRTSITVPADSMGNERPLEIIKERWYSPELQLVLRSKQTDPRFGETTYEVTKLEKGEPPHSLFEVPPDYQVRDIPGFPKPGTHSK